MDLPIFSNSSLVDATLTLMMVSFLIVTISMLCLVSSGFGLGVDAFLHLLPKGRLLLVELHSDCPSLAFGSEQALVA